MDSRHPIARFPVADENLESCSFDYDSVVLSFRGESLTWSIRIEGFVHLCLDFMWDETIVSSFEVYALDDSLRNEILPGDWSQLTRFDSGSPERNRREFKVYRLEFIDGTAIRVVGSSAVCTRGGRTFVL